MGKKYKMASPGLEPETFSVLDWRDNQLHHDTLLTFSLNNLINTRWDERYEKKLNQSRVEVEVAVDEPNDGGQSRVSSHHL